MALFETLVNLNCEDIMLELCLGALSPCSHVMLSQRRRLRDIDPFGRAAEKFLSLTPSCCAPFASVNSQFNSLPNNATNEKHLNTTSEYLKSLPTSINYGARLSDSLYGNYHAYLCDARQKIRACRIACSNWSYQYNGELPKDSTTSSATTLIDDNTLSDQSQKKMESKALSLETLKHSAAFNEISDNSSATNVLFNIQSLLDKKDLNVTEEDVKQESLKTAGIELSLEEQVKLDADIAELLNEDIGISESAKETLLIDKKEFDSGIDDSNTAMNSLLSLGESSGYESFAFKGSSESTPDNEPSEDRISEHEEIEVESNKEQGIFLHSIIESSSVTPEELTANKQTKENYRQDVFNGQPNVGIFLDVLLRKLECMTSNNLYVNLHLTGLISRLAIYPQPLLQSFLLNHSLVFQPSIRSLFQVCNYTNMYLVRY